jgi:ABC-type phosphate transport system substrate-binding protein
MKALKIACVLPALIAATAAISTPVHAQTYSAQVLTSGSSAQFGVFAEAAYQLAKTDGNAHHYTAKASACSPACTTLVDSRNSNINPESGNIWIVWSATSGRVWAYTSVDSTVGVRLFSASPRADITLQPLASLPPNGSNALAVWDDSSLDTPLTASVYNVVNGVPLNAANTDIRPEDALYATTRALTSVSKGGLGYGNYVSGNCQVGVPYQSQVTVGGSVATPVSFGLTGTDPCSGATLPAFVTIPAGAAPIVFIANTTDASGLGSSAINNITSTGSTHNYAEDLFAGKECDLSMLGGSATVPVNPILREPLSGTMNTTEFSVFEPTGTQERNVTVSTNPLNQTCTLGGGTRERAIGTGDVTKGVNATTDAIGYVFFSYEALVPTALPNVKYLKLNGYDPLASSNAGTYTGALPSCGTSTKFSCPLPTPTNSFYYLRNGDYKAWSVYRMVTDASGADNAAVNKLVNKAQVVVGTLLPDFVPFKPICGSVSTKDDKGLAVFREHYTTSGITANDGSLPANVTCTTGGVRTLHPRSLGGGTEAGGDVGGTIVFTPLGDQPTVPGPTQSARP